MLKKFRNLKVFCPPVPSAAVDFYRAKAQRPARRGGRKEIVVSQRPVRCGRQPQRNYCALSLTFLRGG
jgi:hypothetical protein